MLNGVISIDKGEESNFAVGTWGSIKSIFAISTVWVGVSKRASRSSGGKKHCQRKCRVVSLENFVVASFVAKRRALTRYIRTT